MIVASERAGRRQAQQIEQIAEGKQMYVPPWTILAGLGSLDRQELADLVAIFHDTSLKNVVVGQVIDLRRRYLGGLEIADDPAFKKRLAETAQQLHSSGRSDAGLRARLWNEVRIELGLAPALPLSTKIAGHRSAELGQSAADVVGDVLPDANADMSWVDRAQSQLDSVKRGMTVLQRAYAGERLDFSTVVGLHGARMAAEAALQGRLDDVARDELLRRIRERLDRLPPELRDGAIDEAIRKGDTAALSLLATGTSLAGLAIAVELAGFGAYIVAAQASAVIPFLGGKAAVSGLAVLSSPVVIVPLLAGGVFVANRWLNRSVRSKLAAGLTVQLALKGLAEGRDGLKRCLDDFKTLDGVDLADGAGGHGPVLVLARAAAKDLMGGTLPGTPGDPPGNLAQFPDGRTGDVLAAVLFSGKRDMAMEAVTVGAVTLGDIVVDAAQIDPTVIAAHNFSRSGDLKDIFDFGKKAEAILDGAGPAVDGAVNRLRGYVAEQIVMARLREAGHQVSRPAASNNPGHDVNVDGYPFQVKCAGTIDVLKEHFEKYPEIPVYANAELVLKAHAGGADWADRVFPVEGFDLEATDRMTRSSLEAAAEIGEFDVPYFAVAVSAARNLVDWWSGRIPLSDLPLDVALNGATKGGLAAAGGATGQIVGMLLLGPAGAVVFTGVGGAAALVATGLARKQIDRAVLGEWIAEVDAATIPFMEAIRRSLLQKMKIQREKVAQLTCPRDAAGIWISERMRDTELTIVESIVALDMTPASMLQPDRACHCLQLTRDAAVHPWTVNTELKALMVALDSKPSLTDIAGAGAGAVVGNVSAFAGSIFQRLLRSL